MYPLVFCVKRLPASTLAQLYDRATMSPNLAKARTAPHKALDAAYKKTTETPAKPIRLNSWPFV